MKKIAIVGPESTGKSALAQALAEYYQTDWVPEVARTYLENLGRGYSAIDVEEIAHLQLTAEEKMEKNVSGILFFDTTLLVIKIWMMNAYGQCPDWIVKSVESRHYDLYLLCDIDLPWKPDPLREHPNHREFFRNWYERELNLMNANYKWVSGIGEIRLENAISTTDQFLSNKGDKTPS